MFVHGGPTFSDIVAVVVPNKDEVWAELGEASDEELKSSEKLRSPVSGLNGESWQTE